jgi:hypothetical protein
MVSHCTYLFVFSFLLFSRIITAIHESCLIEAQDYSKSNPPAPVPLSPLPLPSNGISNKIISHPIEVDITDSVRHASIHLSSSTFKKKKTPTHLKEGKRKKEKEKTHK